MMPLYLFSLVCRLKDRSRKTPAVEGQAEVASTLELVNSPSTYCTFQVGDLFKGNHV